MASISIAIHTPISSVEANAAVPGQLEFKFVTKHDSYPGVVMFTNDSAYAKYMAAAHAEYHRAKAAEIADREADNIANGQDVDDGHEDDGEAEF